MTKRKQWSIKRTHKVTGAVFYLGPSRQIYWVTPLDHEKYGKLYGHWLEDETDEQLARALKYGDTTTVPDFDYEIVPHKNIHRPWKSKP